MSARGWKGLPEFSKFMYETRYFKKNQDYEGWLSELMERFASNEHHGKRMKQYIRNYWVHPSTPISSMRGLPISCFTNSIEDTKESIFDTWHENNWVGAFGGGVGTDWTKVREIGHPITNGGRSSGKIPMLKVSDSATLAVSQGGLRRASQAAYTSISDPEILEFIDIRRPTGDINRRSTNLHHGVKISDAFMRAAILGESWDLISPKSGEVVVTIPAYDLFKKIIISRMETGEPYIMFTDTVHRAMPQEYLDSGRSIVVSNLCTEIFLHTDENNSGVCCLTSYNLKYYDEWKDNIQFIKDVHEFLDNVLSVFIRDAKHMRGFERAVRSATDERSIGLGFMGYHDLLQSKMLPYDSLAARILTKQVVTNVKQVLEDSNRELALRRGPCPISKDKRNTHLMAVAPTASISTLCELASPGIDPRLANVYMVKTNVGSSFVKNPYLEAELKKIGIDIADVAKSIIDNKGSIAHLDIPQLIKDVFATSYEIDNRAIVESVSIMTPFICQGISCNLFLPADASIEYVIRVHIEAWVKGLKSLYYVRSNAISKASIENLDRECISCQ